MLVHGWNESDTTEFDTKRELAETSFKRLYWQGFRGNFYEFDWPTTVDAEGPIEFLEVLNLTYNAGEFQAFRSGQALKNFLEAFQDSTESDFDGDVHLLAHSQANVVVAEALRQWGTENPTAADDVHLVENYVAMEGAVSAGLYGDNATETTIGSWQSDLYRNWSSGIIDEDDRDPSYMSGADGAAGDVVRNAAGTWINMYNPQDIVTTKVWRANNALKRNPILNPPDEVWPVDYSFDPAIGKYKRLTGLLTSVDLTPELTTGDELPGATAYEIIAFMARSNANVIGTKEVGWFQVNTDIRELGMLGDIEDFRSPLYAGKGVNHSFQTSHDAAATWQFWQHIKEQTSFEKTY